MEMLAALRADEFDIVFACTAPSPRGVPGGDVAEAARSLGCDNVVVFDTVEDACARAMEYADGDDAVLATGSLYTVGAARPVLQRYRQLTSAQTPRQSSGSSAAGAPWHGRDFGVGSGDSLTRPCLIAHSSC